MTTDITSSIRSAVLVSHNNFTNATSVEGSIASSLDSQKDGVVNNSDVLVSSTNMNENATVNLATKIDGGSNNDANQNKNTRESQEIDVRAFKSQFDEISNASRLLENAKSTNFNNRYNGSIGQATLTNHLPLRRTNGDSTLSFHTHQRSNSHPHPLSYTNRHHALQHKRSASSISGLSLNGSYSNSGPYHSGRSNLSSLPNTPLGFGLYEQDEYLSLRLHHQLNELNSGKVTSGEIDDDGLRLRTLRDLNNSRYDELDWDNSSTLPSTPGGPFTSLTPSSSHSTRSSTPYFAHSHALLDDDELLEKQLLLEEEQKFLSFQKQKLDNAINQLRYHNNDPNLTESKFKYFPSPPRPRSTTPSSKKQPSRNSSVPSSSQQSPTPPRFQHNHQEPIGTPPRKISNNSFGTNPPASMISASAPDQRSSFSLFSKSPALSLNNAFLPKANEHQSSGVNGNWSDSKAFDGLHGGFPLTPAGTPPKSGEDESYFFGSHYLNLGSNYHAINPGRSSDIRHYHSAPPTPTHYSQFTASQFPSPLTPNSASGYPARTPLYLYSSPVDERDEDALSWDDKAFASAAGFNAFLENDENDWDRCHVKIEHQKLSDVSSSMMTSSGGNDFASGFTFGNHGHGFELEVV